MKRQHDATMQAAPATVLCCSCGVPMVPNQTMRCAQCLKAEVSITEGISRQCVLPHCRTCGRYNRPPWTKCELESRELLGICLKRVKGLGKDVRLVDAAFVWTEEHSRRIRVKITVQKEIANSSVLQQTMVIEFQVVNQQCEECQKSFTPHLWNAIVQVRQKVDHRRTLCYLEQLILKHEAHDKVVSLLETKDGLDFHFAQRSHAQRFSDFLESVLPCWIKNSKHLVSHDTNSNVYHYKYTIFCELCPVCADDLVHMPPGHSQLLSGTPPLMICHKVSTTVHLVDPLTLRGCDIPAQEFWKRPVQSVGTRSRTTEFVVLNVEAVDMQETATRAKHHLAGRGKMELADVEVARVADLGMNDDRLIVRTHLGRILRPGNHVLGYDLRHMNLSGLDSTASDSVRADVYLVRKLFARRKERTWGLRRLARERDAAMEDKDDEQDMEAMRQDLEEDPEFRRNVNMYRCVDEPTGKTKPTAASGDIGGTVKDEASSDEDAPEVPLAELLEGLNLRDDPGT